ncbi:MAG: ArnT family glycosyltransferase [Phycisphaerales bacterium]
MPPKAEHSASRERHRRAGVVRCALVCIALTLVLRVAWAMAVPVEPVSDSRAYFTFASSIAAGDGYGWEPDRPSAYWAVGPSAIYAAAFLVFGPGAVAVVLVNLLASSLMTLFAVLLADRWFGDRFGLRVAWIAGLLFACWPTSIMFTTVLNSEILFGASMLGALVLLFPEGGRTPSWRGWLLAGPVLAVTALIRPTGLLLAPIAAGVHAARSSPPFAPRRTVGVGVRGVACVAVMLACIAPWTVRNYRAFGEFILISTNGGTNFWMGNNPDTTGHYMPLPDWIAGTTEHERSDRLKAEALEYIRAEPVAFLTRSSRKFFEQHAYETIGVAWNRPALEARYGGWIVEPLKLVATGYWWAVLALGLGGWVMLVRGDGLWRAVIHPAFVLWGYFACVHAVTVIQDRYHMQWSPLVMLLGASAAAAMIERSRGRRERGD